MRPQQYAVKLSPEERARLERFIATGCAAAAELTHARILLKADQGTGDGGWTDPAISHALDVGLSTVGRVRRRYAEAGLEAALKRAPTTRMYRRKLDGVQEAHLIALACSPLPDGQAKWSLRLLAEKLVELEYIDAVSHETVRQVLEKNELKPWLKEQWCIPPKANANFVYRMEDVLEVYQRPEDPRRPLVCMDELCIQQLSDIHASLPVRPGNSAKEDYEYQRQGTCNLFIAFEPLRGQRHITVTARRTKQDWAQWVKDLVDGAYPNAACIVLVCDNLNIHTPAALYATFDPAEARRLTEKLEFHYTPVHGSWLNMAEIELSVLARQCLKQRLTDQAAVERETTAWAARRNTRSATVDWRFTTADARVKLKKLYPSFQP